MGLWEPQQSWGTERVNVLGQNFSTKTQVPGACLSHTWTEWNGHTV